MRHSDRVSTTLKSLHSRVALNWISVAVVLFFLTVSGFVVGAADDFNGVVTLGACRKRNEYTNAVTEGGCRASTCWTTTLGGLNVTRVRFPHL